MDLLPKANLTDLPKDILVTLALELDLSEISAYCRLSKRFNNVVCNNFSFWYQKLKKDYGFSYVGDKSLDEIKEYYRYIKNVNVNDRMYEAARLGDKEAVDNAIQKGANGWNWGMYGAAHGGHKDLIAFFIQKGANKWNSGMYGAALGGYKELVEFFIQKGANKWNSGMYNAARRGHKELVDFFIQKGAYNWRGAMNSAIVGGHKDLVEFFKSKMNN